MLLQENTTFVVIKTLCYNVIEQWRLGKVNHFLCCIKEDELQVRFFFLLFLAAAHMECCLIVVDR